MTQAWYVVKPRSGVNMAYKKLVAPTLKELFIKEMEGMILSGELRIGDRLPPERELANMMQISRSAVNDGIVEMSRKGFLEIKPRQGTYVADYHKNGTLEILISLMSYNGGQLPHEEIRSILEMRGVLMNFSLEKAIPIMSESQIDELEAQCLRILPGMKADEAAGLSFDFDHMLSGFSGNTLLPLFFCSFRLPITVLWERYFFLYGTEGMIERNKELLQTIRDRNISKAKSIITASISSTISGDTQIYNPVR